MPALARPWTDERPSIRVSRYEYRALSHAPVEIRRVVVNERECVDLAMIGREVADRIGRRGVAQERKGLATAAAKILLAPRAACARLLHPAGATKGVEGRRVLPDVGERMLAHRPEFETRNALGGVAREHPAGRRDIERAAAPAADTRLGIARIVVRHDRVDDNASVVALA